MAAKDFIVAIELGSSKMTGIAGKKNLVLQERRILTAVSLFSQ